MKVVVDENIPYAAEAFASAGIVETVPGRNLTRDHLLDAHILIVRSVTKVDARLLARTPVKFVGTCTIGTDHLDIPWLESQDIRWSSAPGCNARSVAEWVFSALAYAHLTGRLDLDALPSAGVVGVGRVGSMVAGLLGTAGWRVLLNDPPRASREGSDGFHDLEEVLTLPLVCAHLPLVEGSAWPTGGLLSENLRRLPTGAGFLNAGRGGTVSSSHLARIALERPDLFLALDVFDPEPAFPAELARRAHLVSPHVAGYSLEGKIEGTRMVRQALGQFLNLPPWEAPPPDPSILDAGNLADLDAQAFTEAHSTWDWLSGLILASHDPRRDDAQLRRAADLPDLQRAAHFDLMRKEYPVRLQWQNRPVTNHHRLPRHAWELALKLGFRPA